MSANEVAKETAEDVILISSDSEDELLNVQTSPAADLKDISNSKSNNLDTATNGHNEEKPLSVNELFEKFINTCLPLIKETKDASEIIDFIKARHAKSSDDFKSSLHFRNLLNRCIRKLRSGCNQEFVYINEVATVLGQHCERKRKILQDNKFQDKRSKVSEETNSSTSANDIEVTSSTETLQKSLERQKNIESKIDHYEKLLKRFSDEIKKLQAHELSLDELEQENSIYIQEGKLKKKATLIFQKICELKKVPPKTGRVTEQKVKLSSSRYPEVNRKVEAFVNGSQKFPDYSDINYLVKQANIKHSLHLPRQEVDDVSKSLFQEVGKHLQRVRHFDFVYNFGSYLTDPITESSLPDPARSDTKLQSKLTASRLQSKSALDDVITKFSKKQEEVEASQQQPKHVSDKEDELGTPLPSEEDTDDESDESNSDVSLDEVLNEAIEQRPAS